MDCEFCAGTGQVVRVIGVSNAAAVTCPRCIRGVTTLGAHEMLRGHDRVHQPGEYIDYIESVRIE